MYARLRQDSLRRNKVEQDPGKMEESAYPQGTGGATSLVDHSKSLCIELLVGIHSVISHVPVWCVHQNCCHESSRDTSHNQSGNPSSKDLHNE